MKRWLPPLLAVLVYAGALGAPFIFDDVHSVSENPSIRDLANLKWIFIGSRRFVTNFSYAVDWAIWGASPVGFHLTNVLLHALTVLALYALARRLWQNDAPAFCAASLFAVHPLLSESVAYVSSRAGILCALFSCLSVWAWHRALSGRRSWGAAAVAAWILAAGSKETGLVVPLLWLACDLLFVPGWRRRLVAYAPFALVALAAGLWRIGSYLDVESGAGGGLGARLLVQADVFWRYAFLWVLPLGQSLIHSVAPSRLAWLSVVSLAVSLWLLLRLPPAARFGGLWLGLFLLPSSVMPLIQGMAEHRVYEAAVGAALLSAALLERLPRRGLVLGAVVVALGTATAMRVGLWRDPVRLWEDAARKAPGEWLAHYALGDALRDRGDCAAALDEYARASSLKPEDRRAPCNRAICHALLGRYDEAEHELRSLLAETPADATLHYNLGTLAMERGRSQEARTYLLRAVSLGQLRACGALARLPGELPTVCAGQIR